MHEFRKILVGVDLGFGEHLLSGVLSFPPQIRIINGRSESPILEMVEEKSVDLLIMGTLGRSGIRGVLTGNRQNAFCPDCNARSWPSSPMVLSVQSNRNRRVVKRQMPGFLGGSN